MKRFQSLPLQLRATAKRRKAHTPCRYPKPSLPTNDDLLQAGEIPALASAKSVATLGQILARHVRMAAYADCFLMLSVVFISALVPAYLTRARPPRRSAAAAGTASVSQDVAATKAVNSGSR